MDSATFQNTTQYPGGNMGNRRPCLCSTRFRSSRNSTTQFIMSPHARLIAAGRRRRSAAAGHCWDRSSSRV